MGGVVANHEQVQEAGASDLGGKWTLMAGDAQEPHTALPAGRLAIFEGAAWSANHVPLGGRLDVVERENIDIVSAQFREDAIELRPGIDCGPGLELDANDDVLSAAAEAGDGRAEISAMGINDDT
jgi:hypothetical protein